MVGRSRRRRYRMDLSTEPVDGFTSESTAEVAPGNSSIVGGRRIFAVSPTNRRAAFASCSATPAGARAAPRASSPRGRVGRTATSRPSWCSSPTSSLWKKSVQRIGISPSAGAGARRTLTLPRARRIGAFPAFTRRVLGVQSRSITRSSSCRELSSSSPPSFLVRHRRTRAAHRRLERRPALKRLQRYAAERVGRVRSCARHRNLGC